MLAPQVGLEPTTLRLTDSPGRTSLSVLVSVCYLVFALRSKPYGLVQSVNYFNCFDGAQPIVTGEVTHLVTHGYLSPRLAQQGIQFRSVVSI